MKTSTRIVSEVFLYLLSAALSQSSLQAIDEKDPPPALKVVEGVIKAVDPANNTFILSLTPEKLPTKPEQANEIKMTVDLKTSYWLDDKPTTMDQAMKVGNRASVTHLNGLALKVHVKSKPA